MFNKLFKQKNIEARNLYACALENARNEVFYTDYGVPDTFDGRFDLLLLHIFIILNRMMDRKDYEELSQDLFDVMFENMDQTLREMGIGDVGIPKHMKKMMKAFNGRMHNYQMAISPETFDGDEIDGLSQTSLSEVVARNLYAMELGNKELDETAVNAICAFMRDNLKNTENISEFTMIEGKSNNVR